MAVARFRTHSIVHIDERPTGEVMRNNFDFMNAEEKTDFETWAKLLIRRKVPDDYQHLINSEVIKSGEIILKRGDAFEIHIRLDKAGESVPQSSTANSRDAQILVTPLPPPRRAMRL